jgi:hypothetical protein
MSSAEALERMGKPAMVAVQSKARVKSWIGGLRHRLPGPIASSRSPDSGPEHVCLRQAFNGHKEFAKYLERSGKVQEQRRQVMREMATAESPILTRGYCACCRDHRTFWTNPGDWKVAAVYMPNGRDGLLWLGCRLTCRIRELFRYTIPAPCSSQKAPTDSAEEATFLFWGMFRCANSSGTSLLVSVA